MRTTPLVISDPCYGVVRQWEILFLFFSSHFFYFPGLEVAVHFGSSPLAAHWSR